MSSLRKNVASQNISFQLTKAADGTAVTAGGAGNVSKDGGAQAACAGTFTHLGSGQWNYAPTQGETNATAVGFQFTGTGAIAVNLHFFTDNFDTTAAVLTSGAGTDQVSVSSGKVLLQATQTGVTIPTVTTVTNQLTAAAIATGVWQDATSGDFTVASSIGRSLYTSGVLPGGSGGHMISGTNAGTITFGALTVSGSFTISDGLLVSRSSSNTSAITATGNGTGSGIVATSGSGATGDGIRAVAASTNGNGVTMAHAGSGADLNATTTPLVLAKGTNITGLNDIAATAIVSAGAITTSSGKVSGVVLTDTVTTYTGNTVQTGDAYARIGAAGAGLTALGDTRIANLDAAVSSRTKPADTQAAVTTVTNLTNAPTAGDLTAAMKASVTTAATAATPTAAGVTGLGVSDITTGVWAAATRVLTAGTNIVLAKGTGVTGFNDLDAAGVRSAIGMSSANLDTQLGAIAGYIDTEVGTLITQTGAAAIRSAMGLASANLDTQLGAIAGYIDTEIGTLVTNVAAIKSTTDSKLDVTISSRMAADGTSTLTEAYPTKTGALSLGNALHHLVQLSGEMTIVGTAMAVRKRDQTTTAETFTLNDASSPTGITRAS